MNLLADRIPTRTVMGAIALGLGICALFLVNWWEQRSVFNEARLLALPACTEQLGSEDACREHLARYHDDCARLTFHGSGRRGLSRGQKPYIDKAAYLECVVLGVDGWVAANGRRVEAEAAARAKRPY